VNKAMKDDISKRDQIVSPCINICVVHQAAGICTGCLRSINEIARWTAMQPAERADIMMALPGRAPLLKKRRGGRAGRLQR